MEKITLAQAREMSKVNALDSKSIERQLYVVMRRELNNQKAKASASFSKFQLKKGAMAKALCNIKNDGFDIKIDNSRKETLKVTISWINDNDIACI